MKPMSVILSVALSATLLSLGHSDPLFRMGHSADFLGLGRHSADFLGLGRQSVPDAGVTVTDTYSEFVRRMIPKDTFLACTITTNMDAQDDNDAILQEYADGNNDQDKTLTLGTPTVMGVSVGTEYASYCKYLSPDQVGTKVPSSTRVMVSPVPKNLYFFAKQISDAKKATTDAAMDDVMELAKAEPETKDYVMSHMYIVEITATNEIYAGPIDSRS